MKNIKQIKPSTRWVTADGESFIVLSVTEIDGHIWVHYRKENPNESREYSCYAESFLSRFYQQP